MTLEKLKEKADKKQAELKEVQKQIKEAELTQKKAEEFIQKLETISPEISKAVQEVLDKAKVKLPEGKQIIVTVGEMGLLTSIVNGKPVKTGRGGNGGKTIVYEGREMSWQQLADEKGIDTKGASAHKVIFLKDRALHDSIPHENCPYR